MAANNTYTTSTNGDGTTITVSRDSGAYTQSITIPTTLHTFEVDRAAQIETMIQTIADWVDVTIQAGH